MGTLFRCFLSTLRIGCLVKSFILEIIWSIQYSNNTRISDLFCTFAFIFQNTSPTTRTSTAACRSPPGSGSSPAAAGTERDTSTSASGSSGPSTRTDESGVLLRLVATVEQNVSAMKSYAKWKKIGVPSSNTAVWNGKRVKRRGPCV